MLGAVTVRGTARESRRSIGLILLIVAALAEAYWACTVPIRIPPRQKQQHQDDPSSGNTIMVRSVHAAHSSLSSLSLSLTHTLTR